MNKINRLDYYIDKMIEDIEYAKVLYANLTKIE